MHLFGSLGRDFSFLFSAFCFGYLLIVSSHIFVALKLI